MKLRVGGVGFGAGAMSTQVWCCEMPRYSTNKQCLLLYASNMLFRPPICTFSMWRCDVKSRNVWVHLSPIIVSIETVIR